MLQEKTSNLDLKFSYDSLGNPIAVLYNNDNNKEYYYVKNLQGDIVGLVDRAGEWVVEYRYDAWGNILSTTGSLASSLGAVNPFRYRGYYYDAETGLYYVSSRYYDPGVGRFISADNLIVVDGRFDGINLYAYSKNNPVNYKDPTGHFLEKIMEFVEEVGKMVQQLAPVYAVCKGAAVIDGPLPVGDVIGGIGAGLLTLGAIGVGFYNMSKSDSLAKAIADQSSKSTYIYRYGGTNPGNLVPREVDVISGTGLSFSTVPRSGAAMTTIEAVNATGVLIATKDGPTHVSVYPVGPTMAGWREAGRDSIWTTTLKSIVIKWTP